MAKTIIFPVGGIDRQFAFQGQPPYTTAAACNVRSTGASSGRTRGGSRPGLVRAFADLLSTDPITGTVSGTPAHADGITTVVAASPSFAPWMVGMNLVFTDPTPDTSYQIASYVDEVTVTVTGDASAESGAFSVEYGHPINLLASVRPAEGGTGATWRDNFETRPSGYFLDSALWSTTTQYPVIQELGGSRYAAAAGPWVVDSVICSADAQAIAIDTTKPYVVNMSVRAEASAYAKSIMLMVRMDDAAPSRTTDSVYVHLLVSADGKTCGIALDTYVASAFSQLKAGSGSIPTLGKPFNLSVAVNGNTVSVYFNNASILTATAAAPAGKRTGFRISRNKNEAATAIMVDEFRVEYSTAAAAIDADRSYLFANAGSTPYKENEVEQMVAIGGDVDLSGDEPLDAVEMGGKLYIADYDTPRLVATGLTFSDMAAGSGNKISGVVADYTAHGIDADNDLCLVDVAGTGGAPLVGAYKIGALHSTYIQLSDVALGNDTGVGIRVERAPKVWDPLSGGGTLSIWTQGFTGSVPKGAMPLGCPLIALYQGRIVLGGAKNDPHLWFACRSKDPHDWNYAARDDLGAVAATNARYGQIGRKLTALIAYSDDHMVFGCEGEIWVALGNLRGGAMLNKSRRVGIIGQRAWCLTPGNELVFLSEAGLYAMQAQGGSVPAPISEARLPRELKEIDTDNYIPQLAWDNQRQGVCIWITPKTQGKFVRSSSAHWFYSWTHQAFWRDCYYGAHEPWSTSPYRVQSLGREALLLGCRDGRFRRFSTSVATDDGAPLEAYVLLGPFRLGDDTYNACLKELTGILGETSGDMAWSLHLGDNAEEAHARAVAGTADESGTWSAGRNMLERPRRTAAAAYIKIGSVSGSTSAWELDSILLGVEKRGRVR